MAVMHTDVLVQALREAEVEFYTWDSWVPGPFLQVVTDLCRGGAAFWCEGVNDPAAACFSNSIIIRRRLLTSMSEVYEFVTNAVHSLPDHVVKAERWPAVSKMTVQWLQTQMQWKCGCRVNSGQELLV